MMGYDALPAIAEPICEWYRAHARPLPWREQPSPYHVWLSEIMLQQTRIEAVRPYYARFLAEVPTVSALAALPDDRLLKLWEGLGYYSRARNLRRAAQQICEFYDGELPSDYHALLALPGIGEYTAGAIASIAFHLPYPAVDGNVLRVIARLTGDEGDVLAPETKKRVREQLLAVYATVEDPAVLTQGLMELGEVVCMPNRAPLCEECPLAALCRARADGSWTHIPCRAPKKGRRIERKMILLLQDGEGRYAIRRRPEKGLLAGLWELPQIELAEDISFTDEAALDALARRFCSENGLHAEESVALPTAKHIFTHIEWHMCGRYLNVRADRATGDWLFADVQALTETYALPTAFSAYVKFLYGK